MEARGCENLRTGHKLYQSKEIPGNKSRLGQVADLIGGSGEPVRIDLDAPAWGVGDPSVPILDCVRGLYEKTVLPWVIVSALNREL